jgi:CubicO group peptidase (beta-lactamase class C family)
MSRPQIHGDVLPGWEPVRDAFVENFVSRGEIGAACGVYQHGVKVVDLWGGWRDPKTKSPWAEDTMVIVFSTTKGVSSMALALAHSRGLFGYDERVSKYWPEFAQNGKEQVTVRQLLSHQAGLCAIDEPMDLQLLGDPDRVAAAIAKQKPAWPPGEQHGYHGISLGWYESELLRRVDPNHRTIGRYFADEVAAPLGAEFYIGLPDSIPDERIAVLQARAYRLRMIFNLSKLPWSFVSAMFNPRSITARTFANPKVIGEPHRYNDREMWRIELPASNGIGCPRDIAKVYGEFAAGGKTLGLQSTTLDELRRSATPPSGGLIDLVLRLPTAFTLGFGKPNELFPFGTASAFGTPGAGGSLGFADPDLGLGFGYGMNRLDFYLYDDPRHKSLREAATACAKRALRS